MIFINPIQSVCINRRKSIVKGGCFESQSWWINWKCNATSEFLAFRTSSVIRTISRKSEQNHKKRKSENQEEWPRTVETILSQDNETRESRIYLRFILTERLDLGFNEAVEEALDLNLSDESISFQKRRVSSAPAETMVSPSGLEARCKTRAECPHISPTFDREGYFQTEIWFWE